MTSEALPSLAGGVGFAFFIVELFEDLARLKLALAAGAEGDPSFDPSSELVSTMLSSEVATALTDADVEVSADL